MGGRIRWRSLWLLVVLLPVSREATAHWCDTLWTSAYNVVVRPEQDVLEVPDGESARLRVWVQNNMAYPLVYFALEAQAPGFTIGVSSSTPTVPGFLMPGEKLAHWLTVTRTGGGQLTVETITFDVTFGEDRGPPVWCVEADLSPRACGDQDSSYGMGMSSREVMLKKASGALFPARVPANDNSVPNLVAADESHQGRSLRSSARADYGNLQVAIADLFREWCAGRATWSTDGLYPLIANCPAETATGFLTVCPGTTATGHGWGWLYQHLWAVGELAYRQQALTPRQLTTFRDRLMCGWNDEDFAFKAFTTFVLGYLGDDSGPVRTFLQTRADDGNDNTTTPVEYSARAALFMMGDTLLYELDMDDCLAAGDGSLSDYEFAEMSCAAALNLVEGDDAVVATEIFPRIAWLIPDGDPRGMFAGHLVNLLAWHQRHWVVDAGDPGEVSFYGGAPDLVPPRPPATVRCAVVGGTALRLSWDAVTTDTGGGTEVVTGYRVYFGDQANSCPTTCTAPGLGFDYAHQGQTATTWFEPASGAVTAGTPVYFAVVAVDRGGNASGFSSETSCTLPVEQHAPVADLLCTPLSGDAPLAVSCDATGSSDVDGDLSTLAFHVEGQAVVGPTLSHTFTTAGTSTVLLLATDSGGRWDAASERITVLPSGGGNLPPVASLSADPTSGGAPLTVAFDGSASSDSDGTLTAFAWDFDDGSTDVGQTPSHVFTLPDLYLVTLTVTDDGAPALSGTDLVVIEARENHPPELSPASVGPLFGDVPLQVHADGTGVFDPDGDLVTLAWEFGDGASSTAASADHTYTALGVFTVTLTGTDPLGGAAERQFVVTAGNTPPDASSATVTPISGRAPLPIQLDASGCTDPDGDALTWRWTLGDGTTRDGAVHSHTFTRPGSYRVTLLLADDGFPPLSTQRDFVIDVTGPTNLEGLRGGCACDLGHPTAGALLAAAGLTLLGRRRRRQPG